MDDLSLFHRVDNILTMPILFYAPRNNTVEEVLVKKREVR